MKLSKASMRVSNVYHIWKKFLMGSAIILTWVLWAGIVPTIASQPTHFTSFKPGATWLADDSANIDAHGGNILYDSARGRYLWYGAAYRNGGGVSLYTSTDLYNWSYKGMVLAQADTEIFERPKVAYNAASRKWVMWMHWDHTGYGWWHAGLAVADSAEGPFVFKTHFKPFNHESGDLGMFVDDDGKAYLIYAAYAEHTMRMVELSADYQSLAGSDIDLHTYCEAPGMMKRKGIYTLTTSQCTGWSPNNTGYYTATKVTGPYTGVGDLALDAAGYEKYKTYDSQGGSILKVHGFADAYIYMGDRWGGSGSQGSTVVFLPIKILSDSTIQMPWRASWDLSVFGAPTTLNAPRMVPRRINTIKNGATGKAENIKYLLDGKLMKVNARPSQRWVH